MRRIILSVVCLALAISAAVAKPALVVYTPKGAHGPLPVAVWLHGYRNFPGVLSDADFFQQVADQLSIVIIGIPGTTTLDDNTLQWSEEPVADNAYVQYLLGLIKEQYNLDLTHVALFGFSQGAMVAGDLAMTFPEKYRGALIMSAGGFTRPHLPAEAQPAHATQHYFAVCGAEENSGNVRWTSAYGNRATALGAKSELKLYEGMKEHTRPPDFKEKFPSWISEILELKKN
jgi:pimeloyl-ACP methyl ester carboxylesterase